MASKRNSLKCLTIKFSIVFLLVVIALEITTINGSQSFVRRNVVNMPSIRCILKDPTFIKLRKCILKPYNRTYKLVDIHGVILKPFEKGVMLHFFILKKASVGYKPFGIDVTVDGCKYMDGKTNVLYDWFHHLTNAYTNLNHSCPYGVDSDVIIKYPTSAIVFPSVFPEGEYMFEIEFCAYGVPRIAIRTYITMKAY